ncbi:MAG: class I SAM-dependent methyltransferase, partial [Proteobacteria bacterium]|nr:class I SAM-dependent methyltransferase [Pseudomonadota bacterium]
MLMTPRKDAIRAHFESLSDDRDRWISRNRAYYDDDRRYTQFVVPAGARVLELGCGTGDLLAQLKPSHGVGVDFSARMVETAQRNHPDLTFLVGDAEDDDFISGLDGPFDYIVLSDTIGYLDDIERVFRSLRKIAAP